MICKRLREERERLGISQSDFAIKAHVTRNPYASWEAGKTSPTAAQLSALADTGADVLYILTGRREAGRLSADENELLTLFRAAPLAVKAAAVGALQGGQLGGNAVTHTGSGDAAGRDLIKKQVVNLPPEAAPEAVQSHDFERATGMKVHGREARQAVDKLLQGGCPVQDLRLAWRLRSLRWDAQAQALTATFPPGEKGVAFFLFALPWVFWLCQIPQMAGQGLQGVLALLVAAGLFAGASCWVRRDMILPRRIVERLHRRGDVKEAPFISRFPRIDAVFFWMEARLPAALKNRSP